VQQLRNLEPKCRLDFVQSRRSRQHPGSRPYPYALHRNPPDKKGISLDFVQKVVEYISIHRPSLNVRFDGTVTILTGDVTNTLRLRAKTEAIKAESLVTQLWVQGGDPWQQASFQATRRASVT
jgi:hypothetical protein